MSENTETMTRKRPAGLRGKPFIVQCVGFRCMAYRDTAGKWRDYFNDDEIQGEVTIISAA
jgi:hypothetical protein